MGNVFGWRDGADNIRNEIIIETVGNPTDAVYDGGYPEYSIATPKFLDYQITSPYGTRADPKTGETKFHRGTDYATPTGTVIDNVMFGVVDDVGYDADGLGKYVKVKDFYGNIHTYAHLSETLVVEGQKVARNADLGLSGNTGRTTGPHLHYAVQNSKGEYVDGGAFALGLNQFFRNQKDEEIIGYLNVQDLFGADAVTLSNELYAGTDITAQYISQEKLGITQSIVYIIVMIILIVGAVLFVAKSFDIKIGKGF